MPKANRETHSGCAVRGVWRLADGSSPFEPRDDALKTYIQFTPARGGIYKGTLYASVSTRVSQDSAGSWSVTLPPSTVMGSYQAEFFIRNKSVAVFSVEVPDAKEAWFIEIIKPEVEADGR